MKAAFILFTLLVFCWTIAYGQTKAHNKVYVSKTLEYLRLINDSTLWTSIGEENGTTTYHIQTDALFIKNEYWQTGANHQTSHFIKWQDYKILKRSNDSLFLLNKFKGYLKPYNWEDTLKFISLDQLKETVTKFQYLKLDNVSPFDGILKLSIDSSGKITYERNTEVNVGKEKLKALKGELTKKEFARFLDTLSYSLPSRLAERRSCAIDAAVINFEISVNDKKIISKGCSLKWSHAFLFNYLYEITKNKGFVKSRRT